MTWANRTRCWVVNACGIWYGSGWCVNMDSMTLPFSSFLLSHQIPVTITLHSTIPNAENKKEDKNPCFPHKNLFPIPRYQICGCLEDQGPPDSRSIQPPSRLPMGLTPLVSPPLLQVPFLLLTFQIWLLYTTLFHHLHVSKQRDYLCERYKKKPY